ncbi:MAG: pantetheine-phosphate adenylyltransferase [Candidatus Gastranaerophilaceae bacterium]
MKIAIYPGSFDPVTKGHLDVLRRAAGMFDKVIIAVLKNSSKRSFLPIEDRLKLIQMSCDYDGLQNVEVDYFQGLTIDYARQKNANVLIRGLRAVSDFEYEMQLSQTNNALAPDINTVFLITKPKYNFISSSTVKEVAMMGGDISKFVPPPVAEYIKERINKE